jgi:cold shock CspA family protein
MDRDSLTHQRHSQTDESRQTFTGTVKSFDSERGFGFIEPDNGGPDIYVHFSAVKPGYGRLEEGQRVGFEVTTGEVLEWAESRTESRTRSRSCSRYRDPRCIRGFTCG